MRNLEFSFVLYVEIKRQHQTLIINKLAMDQSDKESMNDSVCIKLEQSLEETNTDNDDGEQEEDPKTSNGTDEKETEADHQMNEGDEKTTETNDNPYAYLQRDEFTSERFKIEVCGLPKYYGFGELRKFFVNKLKINAHKIIPPKKGCSYMFVNFKTEEDRQSAIKKIDGYVWKKKTLTAKFAKPAVDPLVRKRMNEEIDQNETGLNESNETVAETIRRVTTPWWNIPYPEQLKRKMALVAQVFAQMRTEIFKANKVLKGETLINGEILEEIKPSPMTSGYRNKCEFSIGSNPENKEKTVGFRLSSYKRGSIAVGPVENVTHIPECMRESAVKFQDFIRQSKYEVYDPETHVGCFRNLTVRTTSSNDVMMMLHVNNKQLTEEEFSNLKEELKSKFSTDESIKSFYLKYVNEYGNPDNNPPELLFGKERITEQLLGLKFEISPEAFFQINVGATEVLYKIIGDLLEQEGNATLLDVCSGTGTIGLSVSNKCSEVLGIEMVASAVEDAKRSAEINGLSEKCWFFVGKAEDITEQVIARAKSEHIIAVVDPPRAGLHQKVIYTLRKCNKIQTLIYVACNAKAAMKNFIDLARPSSNSFRGKPYIPVKFIPVDMFPNSPHFELVIVFKRMST